MSGRRRSLTICLSPADYQLISGANPLPQMALKNLVIEAFIPPDEVQKVQSRAQWDDQKEQWALERVSDFAKREVATSKRPVSAANVRRPTTDFAKASLQSLALSELVPFSCRLFPSPPRRRLVPFPGSAVSPSGSSHLPLHALPPFRWAVLPLLAMPFPTTTPRSLRSWHIPSISPTAMSPLLHAGRSSALVMVLQWPPPLDHFPSADTLCAAMPSPPSSHLPPARELDTRPFFMCHTDGSVIRRPEPALQGGEHPHPGAGHAGAHHL